MNSKHILIIDPIAFPGGSKIATRNIIQLMDKKMARVTVVTSDPDSWESDLISTSPLLESGTMARKEQGIGYFLRHYLIIFSIILARLRFGRFDIAIGASGPGVDFSLYLARKLFHYDIIQLVHGPVASSRSIARALLSADKVFYLESTRHSLVLALSCIHTKTKVLQLLAQKKFETFVNGLPESQWPSKSNSKKTSVYWAASLLKWKGLDTLLEAFRIFDKDSIPLTHICYIKPQSINLEISRAPVELNNVYWHEQPENLDQIRSQCNIFISTSHKEPFGLSILESMAAGLAVIIPADGSYWDKCLQHEINCLKYKPGDAQDLAEKIEILIDSPQLIQTFGKQVFLLAQQYHAEQAYAPIIAALFSKNHNASISYSQKLGNSNHV